MSHLFSHPPVAVVFGESEREEREKREKREREREREREKNRRKIGRGRVALEVPEVSRESFLPKTDRATRGCRSYTHTNRATLCHEGNIGLVACRQEGSLKATSFLSGIQDFYKSLL